VVGDMIEQDGDTWFVEGSSASARDRWESPSNPPSDSNVRP